MSVVELHAEVLYLLLRVNRAPALRRDGSIDGLAGGGGFEQRAIFTTLLPLRGVLILDGLLRAFAACAGVDVPTMVVTPVTAPAAPAATVNTRRREILLESVIVTVLLC